MSGREGPPTIVKQQRVAFLHVSLTASGPQCTAPSIPVGGVEVRREHLKRRWGATVVQEVKTSFSNQKVASSIPCRSALEQDTEPLIAPDVQCAISVNVKCVYIVSRTYDIC